MYKDKTAVSVLIVSSSDKVDEYLRTVLSSQQFTVTSVSSAGEARRMQIDDPCDIVLINTPLRDEFGTELAVEFAESDCGVMVFVKNEVYDQVCYKVEEYGVLTYAKPGNKTSIYQSVKLLVAASCRMKLLQKKAMSLEAKMKEIRLINRAKWVLIDRFKMSESEAHKYIEKSAMDHCVKRSEIAENIIRTYDV